MLTEFANKLTETPGEMAEIGRRFNRAVATRDWDAYARSLSQLVEKQYKKPGGIELAGSAEGAESKQLRDLLSRTLTFAVASLLTGNPTLVGEAEALGAAVKTGHSDEALNEIAGRLSRLKRLRTQQA